MRATEFEFYAPRSLEAALEVLGKYEEEAKVLAGGMSMMPAMNLGLLRPAAIVSLNHLAGLDGIAEDKGTLRIGAMTRHAQVASSDAVWKWAPLLASAAARIGDVQIRNRGTIGGSLVHADPAGDYLPPSVALGAQLTLAGPEGRRTVGARDFMIDIMRTAAEPTEILVEIAVPKQPKGTRSAYQRLVRVEGNFAIATAAAVVGGDGVTVVLGGVTSKPVVVEAQAAALEAGDEGAFDALGDAAYEACADAYGDLIGTSEYRREMARVYAKRAVRAALTNDQERAVTR
jgi:carbon-monoxide dehydrogenase medium subunit